MKCYFRGPKITYLYLIILNSMLFIWLSIDLMLRGEYTIGVISIAAAVVWIIYNFILLKNPIIKLDKEKLEINYGTKKSKVYLLSEIEILKVSAELVTCLHKEGNKGIELIVNLGELSRIDRNDFKRTMAALVG